jgi:hypothetical protein
MFSSRTIHCDPRTSERTERFGPSTIVALPLETKTIQTMPVATHTAKRISKERILDMMDVSFGVEVDVSSRLAVFPQV